MPSLRSTLTAAVLAVGLTGIFWTPLWRGGGLIGGDLYTYFFPQKSYFAEHLRNGEFPLWNNLVGHGYPIVAESQTGALYPLNPLLYRFLNVNTAYNVSHLLHYVAAFLCCWLYARKVLTGNVGPLFAALVYTYAWFPPRCCLEWAAIGGVYLPLCLWCVESFLQTRFWRYLIGLSVALAIHLGAGHFNLAFIEMLTVTLYTPARLWWARDGLPAISNSLRTRLTAGVAVALLAGLLLAAVQLVPTWELKRQSQRASIGQSHNPGYGHIPVWYWSQVVAPWLWYAADVDIDGALNTRTAWTIDALTNKVEAHLYFGMIPLLLIVAGCVAPRFGGRGYDRRMILWALLGIAALLYTPGWLLVVTKYLPGFSFFMGPGRYGIVTTLAAALLAGSVIDQITAGLKRRGAIGWLVVAVLFAGTTYDLYEVAQRVTYAFQVPEPPILKQSDSAVAKFAAEQNPPARLYSRGPNLPTLARVASTPQYLGLGPAAYFDPALKIPEPKPLPGQEDGFDFYPVATPEKIAWLRGAGVTHVLSYTPLSRDAWPVEPVWQGFDELLNRAWARYDEPLYLYRLAGGRGRISWENPSDGDAVEIVEYRADRIAATATTVNGGRVVLTDLNSPGWTVSIDGEPAESLVDHEMFRAVDVPAGTHAIVWSYRPQSLLYGGAVSAITFVLLAALAHVRYWHPRRLRWLEDKESNR